ncbi:MAG: PHP domain-containing protein [Bryobacteraceae bacterium]|nr:PHP domain-containing protein [Bryobacteraceae bacterium]MDW8380123.1 PHP domain-containing protein [Bryobacterales bacterium]
MIDLHTHTNHSDGTATPSQLIRAAEEAGLKVIAITDHDTLSGWDEAVRTPHQLELIQGIELTTRYGPKTVHLLGYFLDGDAGPTFRNWLDQIHAHRLERNWRLVERLQQLGIEISWEEVESLGGRMAGRPHFARLLVKKGYASSPEQAFERYLGEDGLAFVHRQAPSLEEGIRRIRQAGGIPSLAHPARLNLADEETFLRMMKSAGLVAVEALHSDHDDSTARRYAALARRLDLVITGGSDYHGATKPSVTLGNPSLDMRSLEALRNLKL